MVDKQQRAMLVVPYTPGPAPRIHLGLAFLCACLAAVSALVLFVADYSTRVAATIATSTAVLAVAALWLTIAGVRARRQYRIEMERAVDVTPAAETEPAARSEQAI